MLGSQATMMCHFQAKHGLSARKLVAMTKSVNHLILTLTKKSVNFLMSPELKFKILSNLRRSVLQTLGVTLK